MKARFLEMEGNKVKLQTLAGEIIKPDLLSLWFKDKEYIRGAKLRRQPPAAFDQIMEPNGLMLDLSNDEKFYKFSIPCPHNLQSVDLYVNTQIVINPYSNLDERYKVVTVKNEPIPIKGPTMKKFSVEMGNEPAGKMGFDVSTQTTYNPQQKSFYFVVRPTIRVIRGKPGASTTELQKKAIAHRVDATKQQITKHEATIKNYPANLGSLETFIKNLQADRAEAVRRCNFILVQNLSIKISQANSQLKILNRRLVSAKAGIPKAESEIDYLESLTKKLDGIDHILVKFEIYAAPAGKLVFISGQSLPVEPGNN